MWKAKKSGWSLNAYLIVSEFCIYTVCSVSGDPPEKILNIFASENAVYTIFLLLRITFEYYSFTEQNNFGSHDIE